MILCFQQRPETRSQAISIEVETRSLAGFTLVEVMASMAASVIIIGGLLISSISMQRVLSGSEHYATAYSDQHRLIDYLSRDLRRAVTIEVIDAAGKRSAVVEGTVQIEGAASLIVGLPGYYQSNVKDNAAYQDALDVFGTEDRLDYGTADGLAGPVEVSFRKVGQGTGRGVSFTRVEAGVEEVIVRDAADISVEVRVSSASRTAVVAAAMRSHYGRTLPLILSTDRVLLRNPTLNLEP